MLVKWIVAAVVLVVVALGVAQLATTPNKGFADGAAVLAMVSLLAVGIERGIEMFWSLVKSRKGGWWPLNEIAAAVDSLVNETNATVQPAFDAAIAGLDATRKGLAAGSDALKAIDTEVQKIRAQKDEYEKQIQRIGSLVKDDQRVQLLATAAFQAVNRLDTAYGSRMPAVRQAFNDASQVTTGVSDLLAGFKDNPAKKMISVFVGSFIGLVVAGFAGLDLFAAAGAPLSIQGVHIGGTTWFPYFGVALTGLVLGLGANPTHEVVKYVSESAKARRTDNIARPEVTADLGPLPGAFSDEAGFSAGGGSAASMPRVRPGSMNLSRRS
jgi:hypothetical protein